MMLLRLRDLGYSFGELPPGFTNSLGDIPGVRVGHETVRFGNGKMSRGSGPACTGVTVVLPHDGNIFREKVVGAVHTINGYGKAVGFEQVRELGLIEAPIALTNTLNIGLVLDALVEYAVQQSPEIGIDQTSGSVNILVGETNDSYLNDIQGRHVKSEHVWSAIQKSVNGQVEQGSVGAGAGTICFGWKGGIGSASRKISTKKGDYMLGTLVQSNFGASRDLTVLGVPIGSHLLPPNEKLKSSGSVMVILATDAPLNAHELQRLCVRVIAGLARTGAHFSQTSGDFVIAFSTASTGGWGCESESGMPAPVDLTAVMDMFFRAVVEAVEESVVNSLTCAQTTIGRDGHTIHALPVDRVIELLDAAGIHRAGPSKAI